MVAARIVVDHAYHRVDYDVIWSTLERDVPAMAASLTGWAAERNLEIPR